LAENKYIIHQNDSIVWNDSDTKDPIFTLDEAASKLLKFPLNTVKVYRAEEIKPTIVIEAATTTTEDSSNGASAGASTGASTGTSTKPSESTSTPSTSTTTPGAGA
jgi:hypothetical protein